MFTAAFPGRGGDFGGSCRRGDTSMVVEAADDPLLVKSLAPELAAWRRKLRSVEEDEGEMDMEALGDCAMFAADGEIGATADWSSSSKVTSDLAVPARRSIPFGGMEDDGECPSSSDVSPDSAVSMPRPM